MTESTSCGLVWSDMVFSPTVADPGHVAPRTYRCAAYGRNVTNKFSHLFCPGRNVAPFATQCLFARSLHIWALEFEIYTLSHHRQTEIQTRLCLKLRHWWKAIKETCKKQQTVLWEPHHDIRVYCHFVCDPRVVATCNASMASKTTMTPCNMMILVMKATVWFSFYSVLWRTTRVVFPGTMLHSGKEIRPFK